MLRLKLHVYIYFDVKKKFINIVIIKIYEPRKYYF